MGMTMCRFFIFRGAFLRLYSGSIALATFSDPASFLPADITSRICSQGWQTQDRARNATAELIASWEIPTKYFLELRLVVGALIDEKKGCQCTRFHRPPLSNHLHTHARPCLRIFFAYIRTQGRSLYDPQPNENFSLAILILLVHARTHETRIINILSLNELRYSRVITHRCIYTFICRDAH